MSTTSGSILGTRVVRIEDPRFLTGQGTYIDNLPLDGALHVAFVRSTVASARIVGIDTSAAVTSSGVVAVYLQADLGLGDLPTVMMMNPAMKRTLLASDTVRFVGEPIVAILATSKAEAVDAAELVVVDFDPLPVVVETVDAQRGEVIVHPSAATNVSFTMPGAADASAFEECAHVITLDSVQTRMAPCPIEPRAVAATVDVDGRLTHWACSQGSHGVRDTLCAVLGLTPDRVRVIVPDVGGGFGPKSGTGQEELFVAWAASNSTDRSASRRQGPNACRRSAMGGGSVSGSRSAPTPKAICADIELRFCRMVARTGAWEHCSRS